MFRLLPALLLVPAVSGCFGATGYRGVPSDHFDGRIFHNLPVAPQPGFGDFLRWTVGGGDIEWPDWVQTPQSRPAGAALPRTIRITFVNHATALIQLDGVNILTDPVWSERVSPVSFAGPKRHKPPGIRFEDLPRIDAVLISHDHHDHCDLVTLRRLWDRFHPRIYAGLGTAALLADADIDGGVDLDWWSQTTLGAGGITPVELVFAPAQHWSARGVSDRDRVLWGSFYLRGPSGSVYFAGDTGMGAHFATIRERLGAPTVALLPIGAYQPEWFMSPSHMSPAQAVSAHLALRATTSVAIHWGTFDLADEGQYQPAGELTLALDAQHIARRDFRILENGELFDTSAQRDGNPDAATNRPK